MSVANLQRDTAFQVRSLEANPVFGIVQFRSLLRQSSQFSNFNFRDYARRKTRDSFREHKNETEERRIQELIQDGLQNLRLLKRQTVISQFYQLDKLVVEGQKTGKETGDKGGIVRQKDTGIAVCCTPHGLMLSEIASRDPLRGGQSAPSAKQRDGTIATLRSAHLLYSSPRYRAIVLVVIRSTSAIHRLWKASRSGRHLENANRSRTGQIDHDVFEGLPVRRWSRQPHTVSQAPKAEDSELGEGPGGSNAPPELAMPRDSQLLPAMSRALLRAARAGCIYIRPTGRAAENEKEEGTDGEDQGVAGHVADRSFTSRKWTTLPKHLEPAEVEFLAKRRPGLISLYGNGAEGGAMPGPMRKTKIKRTDPENGSISIYEVWVPEGHRIEGEITGDVQTIAEQSEVPVTAETPAPGTVVEGVGVVNAEGVVVAEAGSAAVMTPPKRRPPPPKRKGKGIGKGRKKKVMFAPGEGADAATVHGVAPADGAVAGVKEGEDPSRMSVDQSGQDEDEDDGEEGDESDEGDESMMDAKTPETPQAPPSTDLVELPTAETPTEESKDVEMTDALPDTKPPVSEPVVASQEPLLQPPTAPTTHAEIPQADAEVSAAATPAPPAEESKPSSDQLGQSASLEQPAPTESVTSAIPSTTETIPKEESQAPELIMEEKPAEETADITLVEVKPESTPQPVEESLPAPVSASPEKHEETPSEPPKQPELQQSIGEVPAAQPEPVTEESAQPPTEESKSSIEPVSAPEITETEQAPAALDAVPAPAEIKKDVEMGEAPPAEEPAAAQPPVKEPSPTPAIPAETEPEAKPEPEPATAQTSEPPVLDATTPEVSEPAVPEPTPISEPQPEEPLAPVPTPVTEPTPATEPETVSAAEPVTEEPMSGVEGAAEEKKDEPEPAPAAPASES
ncbi:uncharacterized protein N7496_005133 [Penicillium cataractarum]|uniref:Complex 1 LYR protein domain-containing protein n=1 Tax=Penicillium cataractarum TaxID=2100454 RepID=A0A9W9VED7_9EURO|nr:uncharacterized protein N7496_005133 [Penicillium cataractarum]KAJ5377724.1 hypothetical protein N7496_005133 [Penicillium cataractarum]